MTEVSLLVRDIELRNFHATIISLPYITFVNGKHRFLSMSMASGGIFGFREG